MKTTMFVAALAGTLGASAMAGAPVVVLDGSLDGAYGAALATQDVQTNFGDSNLGWIDYANGSELDVAYGFIEGGTLHLFLAGNLESNFNKFDLFLDGVAGAGQNKLRGDNPNVDFNGLNRMGDDGSGNGLAFDADFAADFYVTLTCGGGPFSTYSNTSEVLTSGGGSGSYIGSGGSGSSYLAGSNGTNIAIDNSNTAGVGGGTAGASGAGVTTGIEIEMPLSLIPGYTGGDVKVCAFINGGGHDYLSNQSLGGMGAGTGNLGEPRNVNLDLLPGAQYFTVPAPSQPVVGDLDGDGHVNGSDLAMLLGAWGNTCKSKCAEDLNADGAVDAADLAMLLAAWG